MSLTTRAAAVRGWFRRRPVLGTVAMALGSLALFLLFGFRYLVPTDHGKTLLERRGDGEVLVVLVRGLGGLDLSSGLAEFVRQTFPQADLLTSTYQPTPFANIDPYRLADTLEQGIHAAYSERRYPRIVLVGYSMGAVVLRKAQVWGYGLEEDRLGVKGKREWVDHVERFVSLAGVNRGWTIDPRPENMRGRVFATYLFAENFARWTGTGKLMLSMKRGAPFIADLRVQWIRLARDPAVASGERKLPLVIHLLGDVDDIVSREDSQDLAAAKDTRFITLKDTDHKSLVEGLSARAPGGPGEAERARVIRAALVRRPEELPLDLDAGAAEDLNVRRIVYVLHGIRDYGLWGEQVQREIEKIAPASGDTVVIPSKYGYFPMLPFLLYGDRQENVRWFMDEYTENLAQFPHAVTFDFIGHSNGTYILASALQRYRTLRVDNVYFAGSVVPQRYPWRSLVAAGRVAQVRNVLADGDWVVALFPQLFEHLAKWLGARSTAGYLDLGSAGFRGFRDASDPKGRIRDVKFVEGGHGAGVDMDSQAKLAGIVRYALQGDARGLSAFEESRQPYGWLDLLSNVAWLVWLALIALLVAAGRLAWRFRFKGLALYLVIVLGILYSF